MKGGIRFANEGVGKAAGGRPGAARAVPGLFLSGARAKWLRHGLANVVVTMCPCCKGAAHLAWSRAIPARQWAISATVHAKVWPRASLTRFALFRGKRQ